MPPGRRTVVLAVLLANLLTSCSKSTKMSVNLPQASIIRIGPGPNVQEETQTALIRAKPGDVIEFGEGTYEFTKGLDLRVENVTIRGQGIDKTALSFKGQDAGKQGLLVTRDKFVIEDLSADDTKGDAVKAEGADGVVFRRVRAQWTGGPKSSNGAYGLYAVQCKNVLIEECVAIGASDAGIYVGQSQNIIVRQCRAERNVAGIEIENSQDADVHDNVATKNAGGLLVFDLPDLPVKNGRRIRVFNNKVFANNHVNFATPGSKVAAVASGTGMMVLATDQVELFKNEIKNNQTYNLAILSYYITGRELKDDKYDPVPEGIYVHDNTFAGGGTNPGGERAQMLLGLLGGTSLPDIIYDGVINPAKLKDGRLPADQRVYIKNNGNATFANLNWGLLMPQLAAVKNQGQIAAQIMSHKAKVERDLKPYEGELKPLPAVTLPGS